MTIYFENPILIGDIYIVYILYYIWTMWADSATQISCTCKMLHQSVFWICNFNFSKSISPKHLIKIILCIEKAYICMRKFLYCDFRYFFSYVINKIKIPIPAMLIQAFLPPNWGCNVLFLDFAKRLIRSSVGH